ATGRYPRFVTGGDLNGDGLVDVVVANWLDNTISVFPGAASGGFGPRTDYGAGATPAAVAIGDVDGDRHPDVVVTNYYTNTVSVLLNTGAPVAVGPSSSVRVRALQVRSPRPNPCRGPVQVEFALPSACT